MIVFVVLEWDDHEFEKVEGVFTDERSANNCARHLYRSSIEERELQGDIIEEPDDE